MALDSRNIELVAQTSDLPHDVAIPTIDLAPLRRGDLRARAQAVAALSSACTETGFFLITGHGISESLIQEMHQVTTEFFEQPLPWKDRWKSPVASLYRGYEVIVQDGVLIRENFQAGRFQSEDAWMLAGYGASDTGEWEPNCWPDTPGFADIWQTYFGEVEKVGNLLLELCAQALDLPSDWFVPFFDRQCSGWMANYYPVADTPPPPGTLRLGGHTDSGSLTLLYQDDQPGGLQVRLRSGGWYDVPYAEGTLVVNIGDIMAIWSNGTWADTMHRVVYPETTAARPRISLPFFQSPNRDAMIQPVPTRVGPDRPALFSPRSMPELKRETYENPERRQRIASEGYAPGVVESLLGR